MTIKAIDQTSIQRITSGQVVIDLQTAVKELVENSIDAGATNVEVRFKHYGLKSVEVIDNGNGIPEGDYENIALKHHTSKLETFSDLTRVRTFGFRGEALSSLCVLSGQVTVNTATSATSPLGVCLEMDSHGKIRRRSAVARQTGTTVTLTNLFVSLPVRRKEFERNVKREFGKALALLNAYALGPCTAGSGVRLTVSNQPEKGNNSVQIKTMGIPSPRASVAALWGPKALDHLVDIELKFEVEKERSSLRRLQCLVTEPVTVQVKGLISKFAVGGGRTTTDRQFFYVNGRPCNMSKIQKAFNEVYRSFNASQAPFVMADFDIPTDAYDVNASPDKRTIFLHDEGNLILALKAALESHFGSSRSTYDLGGTQKTQTQSLLPQAPSTVRNKLSLKTGVHDGTKDDKEGTEKSAKDSSIGHDAHSLVVPLSSRKSSSQSLLSSPQPPSSAKDHEEAADSCDLETADQVELGHTSSAEDAMVLDTSVASWNQPLEFAPTSQPPKLLLHGLDSGGDGHARKKRKSNIGMISSERDDIDVDEQPEGEEPDGDQINGRSECIPSGKFSSKNSGILGKVSYIPRKLHKNPRQNLRSCLVGYKTTSSQISTAPEKLDISEDEEDEEVDQLLSDAVSSDLPVNRNTDLASVSVTGRPDVLPDNVQDPGPAVRTTVLSSVDLTPGEDGDNDDPSSLLSQARASSLATSSAISHKDKISCPEIIRGETTGPDISLKFDLDCIKQVWAERPKKGQGLRRESTLEKVLADAGVSNAENDEKAVHALSRVIEKDDFATMDVIGQFNLGFIIVRRRKSTSSDGDDAGEMDDLFIVDQHAADEKYYFETLQSTTVIQSQKLMRRQPLELTAADELLAMENKDVLRQNGFEIEIDECASAGIGSGLYLTTKPISGNTVFDMKDLEEIIHLMRDRPSGQMVRCSKVRAMFAMRACRKSVMIGMPLNPQLMTTVIRHMGTIDQPWNCPHGRPTMRHLLDMRSPGYRLHEPPPPIDWSAF